MGGAQLGEFLILNFDELGGYLAVGRIPKGIDAQGLHIDALGVHGLQTVRQRSILAGNISVHQLRGFGHGAMSVDVDGLHAAAAYHHLPAPLGARLRLGV